MQRHLPRPQIFLPCSCVVVCFLCYWVIPSYAISLDLKHYCLSGTAECIRAENWPFYEARVGKINRFLIAIGESRVVVGWDVESGDSYMQYFYYVDSENPRAVILEVEGSAENGMPDLTGNLSTLNRQSAIVANDDASRFANAQRAAFSMYPFAVFFSSRARGVTIQDVTAALKSDRTEAVSSEYSTGTLVIKADPGLELIEFLQDADDDLVSIRPGQTLRDAKVSPFKSGLQRSHEIYTFDPALTSELKAPWVVECSTIREDLEGNTAHAKYRMVIDGFSTDESKIASAIDDVMALIPEGENVITDERIAYVWRDGRVERKIDVEALAQAEGVSFQSSATGRLLFVVNIAIIVALLFLVLRRRRAKS